MGGMGVGMTGRTRRREREGGKEGRGGKEGARMGG